MSMFDHHDPDYSTDRIFEYADRIKKERQENPVMVCAYCNAKFDSMPLRALHELTDHDGEAA
ncbi:MAG: hypothetical protein NUW01_18245 [Gemmatimonadaceae bacterium]|nr:hypothetical protein [Gemmatimonadaceae bacterium]